MPPADSIRQRLPAWHEIYVVFLTILFPVNFWSLIFFFRELPSYLLRMPAWDIIGVLAYILVFAVLDGLFLIVIYILLCLLLPHHLIRDHFTTAGLLFTAIAVIAAIAIHYIDVIDAIFQLKDAHLAVWIWCGVACVLFWIALSFLLRSKKMESGIESFLDRFTVLSSAFFMLNIAAVFITILRNLGLHT